MISVTLTRLFAAAFASLTLLVAGAAQAGDPTAGQQVARTWCAQCHIVEAGQAQANDAGPTFAQIANDPSKSLAGVKAWLNDPHPPMPNLDLTHAEIRDLLAYFKTLKRN